LEQSPYKLGTRNRTDTKKKQQQHKKMGLGSSTPLPSHCPGPPPGTTAKQYRPLDPSVLQGKQWITEHQGLPVYVAVPGLGACYFWGYRCYANGVRTAAVQPLDPLGLPDPTTGATNMFIGQMREVPIDYVQFVDMIIERFQPDKDKVRLISKDERGYPQTFEWKWSKMQYSQHDSPEGRALRMLRTDFPQTAYTAATPVDPPVFTRTRSAVRRPAMRPAEPSVPLPQQRQQQLTPPPQQQYRGYYEDEHYVPYVPQSPSPSTSRPTTPTRGPQPSAPTMQPQATFTPPSVPPRMESEIHAFRFM